MDLGLRGKVALVVGGGVEPDRAFERWEREIPMGLARAPSLASGSGAAPNEATQRGGESVAT